MEEPDKNFEKISQALERIGIPHEEFTMTVAAMGVKKAIVDRESEGASTEDAFMAVLIELGRALKALGVDLELFVQALANAYCSLAIQNYGATTTADGLIEIAKRVREQYVPKGDTN